MAKKPEAARGKTTRKGKMKKILRNVIARQSKIKDPGDMSPGAMGGRTKAKGTPKTGKMSPGLGKISQNMRRQKLKGKLGVGSMITGAGASGTAMSNQAMKLAKKLKPSGRLNADDIKKIKEMMLRRKGK